MNTHVRIVVALLLGALVFAVTTVAVTAGFEPGIEFSLLIGFPVGVSAGLTALFAGYVLLWYRDLAAAGTVSERAVRLRLAALATVADLFVVTAAGVTIYTLADGSTGIGLLVAGLPVTLPLAAVVGYLTAGRRRRGQGWFRT
ncbi:hypothetical protein BVU17_05070 [Haloarcula taiwanensis]|uniref:DUF8147 domain-containing protein n=1 Tax=Haloarcula taiwanensis TaxID=1932004 RepID=A0A2H4ZWT2_9EURY|nr:MULTISPECIES: hypothetical protein [Haloarcula]AUG46923.1 hypothetical protein BVU17_05070 [Haloarcula taiwanensis]RLM37127.1 hypothetical protein DVK01_11030 [Haloarcula sp. Atlit-120R]RLM44483.1 hypothetical protein DVK00_08435 [Haloarcula sp. Atlit-47R]RLN01366.1 hypothetical protein D3D01_00690 [Haloarcula sp. Atlit-7R]